MNVVNDVTRPYIVIIVSESPDDTLICSKAMKDHERHLKQVLRYVSEHELYAKASQCKFAPTFWDDVGPSVSAKSFEKEAFKTESIRA